MSSCNTVATASPSAAKGSSSSSTGYTERRERAAATLRLCVSLFCDSVRGGLEPGQNRDSPAKYRN
eukprot:CAMPEP_0118886702 /NCGR_PEP_ID=MMETSP1163-20130328/24698_1 /TAXON_ID=124430 /ORGANISM="Phaeomonas parva, Strain CCMP2877" /LENGTH=65 /DNA_ID=CAMNT_0006824985 /DNA_START=99 /DNA_END=293 /DNA_ORIENTATION=+